MRLRKSLFFKMRRLSQFRTHDIYNLHEWIYFLHEKILKIFAQKFKIATPNGRLGVSATHAVESVCEIELVNAIRCIAISRQQTWETVRAKNVKNSPGQIGVLVGKVW